MLEKKSHGVQLHFKNPARPKEQQSVSLRRERRRGSWKHKKPLLIPDNSDSGYLGPDRAHVNTGPIIDMGYEGAT